MLNKNEISAQTETVLDSILNRVPFIIENNYIYKSKVSDDVQSDFIATINIGNEELKLVGEIKQNLQPRHVFDAIRQVKAYCSDYIGESVYPVIVSEYISPRSAEILIEQNVSYFDLAGNCRLCFANIYIEKKGEKSKSIEKRGIKSLFGLKSSRMLRLMLSNPKHSWQIKELATKAELSFGLVSNVRRALLDQQYAIESVEGGIKLIQAAELLNEWQNIYKKNIIKQPSGFYSLLTMDEKLQAIKTAIIEAEQKGAAIMLSGLSSARWLAPFVKSSTETFYADKQGFEILKNHLKLEDVKMGPNVIIEEPKDSFLFNEAIVCAPELKCTNIISTYLDLYIAGEREQEAAEHMKSYLLKDMWENN